MAPTNEKLDLKLNLPERDFEWRSGFQSATKVGAGVWTCEMRIPLKALGGSQARGRRPLAHQPVPVRPGEQGLFSLEPHRERQLSRTGKVWVFGLRGVSREA